MMMVDQKSIPHLLYVDYPEAVDSDPKTIRDRYFKIDMLPLAPHSPQEFITRKLFLQEKENWSISAQTRSTNPREPPLQSLFVALGYKKMCIHNCVDDVADMGGGRS